MPKIEGFPHFFENHILDFPIFCMKASLRECKKVTFLFFSGKFENWTFWAASVQNLSQNGQKCPNSKVFRIFSKTTYWISLIFCMNASLRECKKVTFLFFSGKLKNWTVWAASVQNWPFWDKNTCVGPRIIACLYWKMEKKMIKKVTFSLFQQKFENGPFLAKNGPKSALWPKTPKNGGF